MELGISDCHKRVVFCIRAHVSRLKPKNITYRSLKSLDEKSFLTDLQQSLTHFSIQNETNSSYDSLLDIFVSCLDKHAPLKTKKVRGNQSSFMSKSLRKAIMTRSALRNKYIKNKTPFNRNNYKKQRNICVSLRTKAIKDVFSKASSNVNKNSKPFFNLIKPYLTDKGALCSSDITLLENGELISKDELLVEIFNEYYINIIKYSSGKPPSDITDNYGSNNMDNLIDHILQQYEAHPSIVKINKLDIRLDSFTFNEVSNEEVLKLLKDVNPKKSVGIDTIPPFFVKLAADLLAKPFTDLINQSIRECVFPSKAKIAAVLPFFKNIDRVVKKNYRPVSILSAFSKNFEKILKNQVVPYFDKCLSLFISAYRKHYGTQHVLIRLIEEWKQNLDSDKIVGAILMDLSKAFDCIPHDLLIAKLHAYGFDRKALKQIFSYLKGRRQAVKLNGVYSTFLTLLAGVPQGSILGPILFNIFINDIFLFIHDCNLHGYADDQTISAFADTLQNLKIKLCAGADIAIEWMEINKMIVNPSKFQGIVLSKSKKTIKTIFDVSDRQIESEDCVKLLGITVDDKLSFNKHISKLCNKASGQLNQLFRLKRYLSPACRVLSINSYIQSNFNYCPLVWHFMSADDSKKVENVHKRALRFLNADDNVNYQDLLYNLGKTTMLVSRLKSLCIEIYKTLNGLNPAYMKNIFTKSQLRRSKRFTYNLDVPRRNRKQFGTKSLSVLGPIVWNLLPNEMKSAQSIDIFKMYMKSWGGRDCSILNKIKSYLTTLNIEI